MKDVLSSRPFLAAGAAGAAGGLKVARMDPFTGWGF